MNTLKFKILSLLLLFVCNWAIAQNLPRFKFPVYTAIDSLKNIQYGEAINLKGEAEKLFLDIYAPSADTMKKRPLVVFVHGGGFQTGDKASGYPLLFSKGLAQRGYVCSSINYRLGIAAPQNDTNYVEAMYRAVQDAKAAVRFFRKNAAQYGIDTTQIFIMGGSAGGEASSASRGPVQEGSRPPSTGPRMAEGRTTPPARSWSRSSIRSGTPTGPC
jgi:acetyl esterase/lipase